MSGMLGAVAVITAKSGERDKLIQTIQDKVVRLLINILSCGLLTARMLVAPGRRGVGHQRLPRACRRQARRCRLLRAVPGPGRH